MFLVCTAFSESVCCDLKEAEKYKQRLGSEECRLQECCEGKVSRTVKNVEEELSKAIGNVIQQFRGEKRKREIERKREDGRDREHISK